MRNSVATASAFEAGKGPGPITPSYEPPRLTFVGSLSELVAGSTSGDTPDGGFQQLCFNGSTCPEPPP